MGHGGYLRPLPIAQRNTAALSPATPTVPFYNDELVYNTVPISGDPGDYQGGGVFPMLAFGLAKTQRTCCLR